ncbi:glycosyltransferase family 2 protein [Pasteurella oralis]|uniref:Glycosyltransferase family 2 protein n=1 Tax=Pasteurella oralis TaxID=1071947 RepID=A0ABW4NQF5_9PAST|nr:glycosyltransferase family 2 protein [Pasteurella oralis]
MNSVFNPIVLIPHYNHSQTLVHVVERVRQFQLPILIVDDGSSKMHRSLLSSLEKQDGIFVIYRAENGGKGAAVKTGLLEAFKQGFSHALQVDADGQHNLSDVEKMLTQSKLQPQALVCGRPIYGEDAPKARLYGRKITNFWIMVNTLSTDIHDGMCGFRIYPLATTITLLEQESIGDYMDFDIDILVRLHWRKIPIVWIDTSVKYELNGTSHFRAWKDNWLISKMHARLFFAMLKRFLMGKMK